VIDNEQLIDEYNEMVRASHMPKWLRPIIAYIYKLKGETRLSNIISIGA